VVMPSTPQDAYSLLRAAIQDDNPVLFFEHRWLYDIEGEVDDEKAIRHGYPVIRQHGSNLTIVASSWMVVEALQAARILKENGASTTVIDIRYANFSNMEEVFLSVNRRGYVIIADNDWAFCGLSSEISTQITEQCWSSLKKPPVRIGFTHTPCPTTRPLETLFYPTAETLVVVCNDPDSPDYRKWEYGYLHGPEDAYTHCQVLIPPKYGTGHLVLSASAIFHYKQSTYYNEYSQFTIPWDDPELMVYWPLDGEPIVSERDKGNTDLRVWDVADFPPGVQF